MCQLHNHDVNSCLQPAYSVQSDLNAVQLHNYYKGKITSMPKVPVRHLEDFSTWYTPGVAAVCQAISKDPDSVYELTNKANTIAVITDGTRVLGLGDIGPEASLPVMEGKCLIFKYLGGVDAVPIALNTKDPDTFIDTVLNLQPAFGGINLEDIAQPKCYTILSELVNKADIPVWHDDQQGTATVTLAGLINALKVVGKKKEEIRLTFIGAGAAGIACARLILAWGVSPEQVLMVDKDGLLGKHRGDYAKNTPGWEICQKTNPKDIQGGIPEAMSGSDVVIAFSTPGPGIIRPEWIKTMAKDPVVFACANPTPEIWPGEAREAGAAIIATGRSDFPNQVNNALCFPGIFRGVLDVRAKRITDEMCFAAAYALADYASNNLDENHILPPMTEMEIYPLQAAAVGLMAQKQNLAALSLSENELLNKAEWMIGVAQAAHDVLMQSNCIPPMPEL